MVELHGSNSIYRTNICMFAALCGFVMASHLLKARLQQSGVAINRLVGNVLLAIGILQWIRLTLL